MANTPNWTGVWNNAKVYNQGDLVSYSVPANAGSPPTPIYPPGVSTWISNADGNQNSVPGQTNAWSLFASSGQNGINTWRGVWSSVTVYSAFDAVSFNNASYVSLVPGNQGNEPDVSPTQWGVLAAAGGAGPAGSFTFLGAWSSTATYAVDNIVSYHGSSYVATNTPPVGGLPTDTTYWALVASVGAQGATGPQGLQGVIGTGFSWEGAWSATASYVVNDVVGLLGASYVAVAANLGVNPSTDTGSYWQVMASPGLPPTGVTWTAGIGVPVAPAPIGSLYSNLSGNILASPPVPTLWVYTTSGWVGVI